ncbi:hypothetical protein CCR95_21000 [Thiocystis minor]|uniref:HEAT repeat domain-containing protein n=1 Tax=Thiocystis minor TaxID=61597 RepID=UPI0019145B0D|nr:HEAT repeat domain-containing protein [Thiocystis minor]MBK5966483.1 hypothetical protein [Thiocystis minor]
MTKNGGSKGKIVWAWSILPLFVVAGVIIAVMWQKPTEPEIGAVSPEAGVVVPETSGLSNKVTTVQSRDITVKEPTASPANAASPETQRTEAVVDQGRVEEGLDRVDENLESYLAGLAKASAATLRQEALTHPEAEVRDVAVYYLSEQIYAPKPNEPVTREQVAEAIDTFGNTLRDADESVRLSSLRALREIHDEALNKDVRNKNATFEWLAETARYDSSEEIRELAVQILVYYHGKKAFPVVQELFEQDASPSVVNASRVLIDDYKAGEFDEVTASAGQ